MIYVFGSNLAGRHGVGSAKVAREQYRAEYGVGVGRTGDAYAIPTKDHSLVTLPIEVIEAHIKDFMGYAKQHPELKFYITRVGCGLSGYKHQQMAPLFKDAPANCELTLYWQQINNK